MSEEVFNFKEIRSRMLGDLKPCIKCNDKGFEYWAASGSYSMCNKCHNRYDKEMPNASNTGTVS